MRGARARSIRKLVDQQFGDTIPDRVYKGRKRLVYKPDPFNPDGPLPREVIQVVLGTCKRQIYRKAKRNWKNRVILAR